jgi:cytochrome P450
MKQKRKRKGKKPYWASEDIFSRMSGTVSISLFGVQYELPVTKHSRPIIAVLQGKLEPWKGTRVRTEWKRGRLAQKGMRDIIQALLHQLQETVGNEVSKHLMQEISDRMFPLIRDRVEVEIGDRQQRLLTKGEGSDGQGT